MKHVTIIDIARLAGTSDTTVSRALRDDPRVSEATKERVRKAAAQLGYIPNVLARDLVRQRTQTIGLAIPHFGRSLHFPRLMASIANALFENGYSSYLCINQADPDREAECLRSLLQRRVEGIIFVPMETSDSNLGLLKDITAAGIPIVFLDRYIAGLDVPRVATDNYKGGELVATHLLELGHRSFAAPVGRVLTVTLEERIAGFAAAVAAHSTLKGLPKTFESPQGDIPTVVRKLMTQPEPPTAIFAPNEGILVETLLELQRLGLRVPGDVSIVAFDEPSPAVDLYAQVTYIRQEVEEIGARCVETMIEAIKRVREGHHGERSASNKTGRQNILIMPRLVVRNSCTSPNR
ncbi:MAG: LacI family DNA-binding transcriptional regulator [Bacteroidota bacterium]